MPTATHISGFMERVSFLQYGGCCGTSDFGSATRESIFGSESSIAFVRFRSQHGLPRHATLIFCPGSILLMSTSIGAPAAFARSLGQRDITKGVATAATPMPPTTEVAPIRKRRLSLLTIASVAIPAFRFARESRFVPQNLRIIRDCVVQFEAAHGNCLQFTCTNKDLHESARASRHAGSSR